MTSKLTAEASKLLLLAHSLLLIVQKRVHFERPPEDFQYPNQLHLLFYIQGYRGLKDLNWDCTLISFNEAASIAASKFHYQPKMLRASRENGKMMLEVI